MFASNFKNFTTAEEAVKFFSDKPQDDLFGTRYFPVVVFPENIQADVRRIVDYAKGCSKPIVTCGNIIFGTRCKPSEFVEVINMTYQAGGKVARALEFDW